MSQLFTASQLTSFFTSPAQIGLSSAQMTRLAKEGLTTIRDFADFKEDQLEQTVKNMRIAVPGLTPQIMSARCMHWFKAASIAYPYYESIERSLSPQNMHYTSVLRRFYQEWEAFINLSKENKADISPLSKNMMPIKCLESFNDCFCHVPLVLEMPHYHIRIMKSFRRHLKTKTR